MVITDMAVMEITETGLLLKEVMAPHTIEEVILATGANIQIAEDVKMIKDL
jgi:acetate CoA/acetoacetate CoA-transferase beta subunit